MSKRKLPRVGANAGVGQSAAEIGAVAAQHVERGRAFRREDRAQRSASVERQPYFDPAHLGGVEPDGQLVSAREHASRDLNAHLAAETAQGPSRPALMPVLHRNREVLGAFSSACAVPSNLLPDALRASIVSIGLWVDRFTSDVVSGRDSIELISVNRTIIEGLTGSPAAA